LINYVNKRVKEGNILGVQSDIEIPTFSGMTEEEAKRAQELSFEDEEDEKNIVDELDVEKMGALVDMLRSIFGDDLDEVLKEFALKGAGAEITVEGKKKRIMEYIIEKLKFGNFPEIIKITGLTDDKGKKEILALLRRLTPELRNDLLEYTRSGKKPEKRPASSLDANILQLIKDSGSRQADFMLAVDRCKSVVGGEPGFAEETAPTKGGKKGDKKSPAGKWGSLMTQVSKIIFVHRDNEDARNAIGEKIKDPKWLLREALIQLRRFDELKELGL